MGFGSEGFDETKTKLYLTNPDSVLLLIRSRESEAGSHNESNSVRTNWNPCQSLRTKEKCTGFWQEVKCLISMLSMWTGERNISRDASISPCQGVEVNPKLFVAINFIPNEITHVNTYALTLIALEICWQGLDYRCSWLKDTGACPVGTQTK